MSTPILQVRDVHVRYGRNGLHAVAGVDLDLARGETLGVVGESGCGKSSLARALMQMPPPSAGTVAYNGQELTGLRGQELRRIRLDLQMVFQDPIASLHPLRTVRQLVGEPLGVWRIGTKDERKVTVDEMLRAVGLDPDVAGDRRPGQLSGGQCQRVAIARALVAGARVLICDEPISSLDVSLRATVLNLLEELKERMDLSILFIAHDLAVVRNISDRVMVMYLGKVCEVGPSAELFASPLHPYTRALIDSVPVAMPGAATPEPAIIGDPPSPSNVPSGCRFRTRCPLAQQVCAEEEPQLREMEPHHSVACHFAETPGEGKR
ncbi:ABC transporter ATP-binding protein [Glaciibacter psychrotolerans]|uniref:Peptide/nickel transport system ATP-binding protein n=1 Tax=Glaciibacter psychrotolerans TaxID=670054 RepID=A0A7Z0EI87_9MICO|nr:oligopeptide/dipeptide ABC transporter ATP-binding protein [Leifsonia psychrotolerans]NYJ21347.1 peptide/nickel transport system ATP-binding protein [Leifsonia psychrotolerans]